MNNDLIPGPIAMPVDRVEWMKKLNLSNFINAYYQYQDIQSCGDVKKY